MYTKWTLEDALTLIRAITPDVEKKGYTISLSGNVLSKGESISGLTLYFVPYHNVGDVDGLVALLESLWGKARNQTDRDPIAVPVNNELDRLAAAPRTPAGTNPLFLANSSKDKAFTKALKFFRSNKERIDAFIVGGEVGLADKKQPEVDPIPYDIFGRVAANPRRDRPARPGAARPAVPFRWIAEGE